VTGLILILLVVGVTLMVVLWAGTIYLQSWFYTEASTDVFWQAPAAAAVLTLFFGLWCLIARPEELTFGIPFLFSAEETKGNKPVEYLWAVRKNEKDPVKYKRKTEVRAGQTSYRYYVERDGQPDPRSPWTPDRVVAILVEGEKGEKIRFEPATQERGEYRRFVDPEGWEIREYDDGPTGPPTIFRTGRFLANITLNLLHLGVWFGCLWLLLRFQWTHALGLGIVLWLVTTLTVLPMLLTRAGAAAQESAIPQKAAMRAPVPFV
jgi:hypothetical protein